MSEARAQDKMSCANLRAFCIIEHNPIRHRILLECLNYFSREAAMGVIEGSSKTSGFLQCRLICSNNRTVIMPESLRTNC